MDKQGRLTKWDEWKIGQVYDWVKGRTVAPGFTCSEINKAEGWIRLNKVRTWGWRNRYREHQPKQDPR